MSVCALIEEKENNSFTMTVSPGFAKNLGVQYWRSSILRFGLKAIEVEIEVSGKLIDECIIVSSKIIEELMLPIECEYEFVATDGEIHIGPFIGILAATKNEELLNRWKWMTNFVYDYKKIKGVIFTFSFEAIDKERMRIWGNVYDPRQKQWKGKLMPFPDAIYINARLDKLQREYLRSLYGSKLFNYKVLSKWVIHETLSNFEEINNALPETELYEAPASVYMMMDRYKSIYIKPTSGYGGKGIMKLSKLKNQFLLQYTEKGNNINCVFRDEISLESYLSDTLEEKKYLIQQGLELKLFNNRICDFRVALNKNQYGEWGISGIIARVGNENSIVSNFSSGGSVETFEDVLQNYYQLSASKISYIKGHIFSVSLNLIKILEKSGQYFGKIAIDLAIDKQLKLWIIEVNNRSPNDFLFAHGGDFDTTYQIKLDNMLYAKWLAGFGMNNKPEEDIDL